MKTSLPTALIYGWDRFGEVKLESDIYFEEDLQDDVILYSYKSAIDFKKHFAKHRPDIIMIIGDYPNNILQMGHHTMISSKIVSYDTTPADNILANDVVCQSTFWSCRVNNIYRDNTTPILSIFTPTYKTNERIFRTYESLVNQTYENWEWVVIDDSPIDDNTTWEYLEDIASQDYRVNIHRINPITGGNVGEAKHRAAMLCNGEWLFELDHDDWLISTCLEDVLNASKKYPDAGFIYTDVTEIEADNSPRTYTSITDNWYGNEENRFAFSYAGHSWANVDGKDWVVHHYPDINPKTIRFNIGMPNHCRVWNRDTYHKVNGHNRNISVADDYELIVKTFLKTKFIHLKKMLYVQYNNGDSTVDNNRIDINRRARLIRDYYDPYIHARIKQLGKFDWVWDENNNRSYQLQSWMDRSRYYDREEVLNYIVS